MALIKHRPKLRVRCPAVAVPGEEFPIRVELDAKREVDIAGVDVRVIGSAWVGEEGGWRRVPGPALLARVSGPRKLPAGTTKLEARATLPPEAAPTHTGTLIRCTYEIEVHVHIKHWPDRRERYGLTVGTRPIAANVTNPVLVSTRPPVGGEPYLELALESPELLPGGTVAGAVALGNVETNRYKSITFVLVLRERVGTSVARDTQLHRWTVPVPSTSDASVQFRLQVPSDLVPTHSTPRYRVDWAFEAIADVAWRSAVSMQVPIWVNASGGATPRARLAVPIVGAERLGVLWAAVAKDAGLQADEEGIHGTVGTVGIRVRREHQGKRGVRVVAELTHPSLRLGLQVGAPSGLWQKLDHDITIGEKAVDDRYWIEARNRAQGEAMVRRLRDFLRHEQVAITISDDQTRVEMVDAGYQRNRVDPLVRFARDLARALDVRSAIPLPSEFEATAGAWESFARTLGASLERGDASIRGEHAGMPVIIEHSWHDGGAPATTIVTLAIVPPLEAEPEPARLDTEARALIQRIGSETPNGGNALVLTRDHIEVRTIEAVADPSALRPVLEAMAALSRLLRPRVGPYR